MSSVQIDGAGDGTNLETDPLGVNLRTKPNFTFFSTIPITDGVRA